MARPIAIALLLLAIFFSPVAIANDPPAHDDFANAAVLSGLFVSWTNTTLGATSEPGEVRLNWEGLSENSVWAQWTAPESGPFRIVVSPEKHCTVYRGTSFANLELVSEYPSSVANFSAESGSTYHVRICSIVEPHNFALRLGPRASNETPAAAIDLEGSDFTITAQNWTSHGFSASWVRLNHTLWYKWTAPLTGLFSYSTDTNLNSPAVVLYHLNQPTVQSNILAKSPFDYPQLVATNMLVVTAGTTYLIGVAAAPSTNLTFNLDFLAVDADFPSNALLGGDILPVLQTNSFSSSPTALQLGPLTKTNQTIWIEYTFTEPGILYFKTKKQAPSYVSSLMIDSHPRSPSDTTYSSSSSWSWTEKTYYILSTNTAVRFTFRTFNSALVSPATAWIDDLHFVPYNPRPAHVRVSPKTEGMIEISSDLERYYSHGLQSSTNLIDWVPRAAVRSSTFTNWIRILPSTNSGSEFFRIRTRGGLNPS
jgi:hypothetical protein